MDGIEIVKQHLEGLREISNGHLSSCAVYNAPAFEPGPCDCGYVEQFSTDYAAGKHEGAILALEDVLVELGKKA